MDAKRIIGPAKNVTASPVVDGEESKGEGVKERMVKQCELTGAPLENQSRRRENKGGREENEERSANEI